MRKNSFERPILFNIRRTIQVPSIVGVRLVCSAIEPADLFLFDFGLRIEKPVHMNDEIPHFGIVHRHLRFLFPGPIGGGIIGIDADNIQGFQILETDSIETVQFTAKHEMQQLIATSLICCFCHRLHPYIFVSWVRRNTSQLPDKLRMDDAVAGNQQVMLQRSAIVDRHLAAEIG